MLPYAKSRDFQSSQIACLSPFSMVLKLNEDVVLNTKFALATIQ